MKTENIINEEILSSHEEKYLELQAQTILEFSNNIIENSTDLESYYVDFVNDHFWDLI